jgi:ABC-type spermidine/putrescine transport system permease subunit II
LILNPPLAVFKVVIAFKLVIAFKAVILDLAVFKIVIAFKVVILDEVQNLRICLLSRPTASPCFRR